MLHPLNRFLRSGEVFDLLHIGERLQKDSTQSATGKESAVQAFQKKVEQKFSFIGVRFTSQVDPLPDTHSHAEISLTPGAEQPNFLFLSDVLDGRISLLHSVSGMDARHEYKAALAFLTFASVYELEIDLVAETAIRKWIAAFLPDRLSSPSLQLEFQREGKRIFLTIYQSISHFPVDSSIGS